MVLTTKHLAVQAMTILAVTTPPHSFLSASTMRAHSVVRSPQSKLSVAVNCVDDPGQRSGAGTMSGMGATPRRFDTSDATMSAESNQLSATCNGVTMTTTQGFDWGR